MTSRNIFFESGENRLEGVLYEPEDKDILISIVLHPHPSYGGSMYNNVVDGICSILNKNNFGAFKFNVSGVGRSSGHFEGFKKAHEDVKNSIEYLRNNLGYNKIGFIGYSWGSYAGLKALFDDNSIIFLAGVSPPINLWNYNFLTKKESKQPKCFVVGEYDNFCDSDKFEELFEKIPVEKKVLKLIPTDHFYMGYEEMAANFILDFIKSL